MNATKLSTDRQRLNAALRDLRTLGYAAEGNFACCASCGTTDIIELATGQQIPRGLDQNGRPHADPYLEEAWLDGVKYVFWNAQDDGAAFAGDAGEVTRPRTQQTLVAPLCIRWCGDPIEIAQTFSKRGFTVSWDGRDDRVIFVYPPSWSKKRIHEYVKRS